MRIFSEQRVNTGRQTELDLLRGFTALILIICHVGLYLGNPADEGLWTFCDLIGSEFAAPVLMALMGISMLYSRHQEPEALLKRGVRLFLLGYALNFVRSLLPLWILGNVNIWTSAETFFVVDILPFAGLSFMLIALFRRWRLSNFAILLIAMIMVIVDQFIMFPETFPREKILLTGVVNLFCPVTEWSCFPLLTWFFFPAFGLVFGEALTHCADKKKLYGILLPAGLLGVLYVYGRFCRLYPDYPSYYWGGNFYYMGLKNVLLTVLFICFAISFWFFADKALPAVVKSFLFFLSKNLNTFYILSWIIISTLIHAKTIRGWQFTPAEIWGLFALITAACAGGARLWVSAKKKFALKKVTL